MANSDMPHGFWVVKAKEGGFNRYHKDSSSSAILTPGDGVIQETDGNIVRLSTGSYVKGIVVSLQDVSGKPVNYLGATDEGYAVVCDDPDAEFRIQDDASATLTSACLGANCDPAITDGDITLGQSNLEIAANSVGTSSALSFRIIKLWDGIIGGEINEFGANCELVVKINLHQDTYTTGV